MPDEYLLQIVQAMPLLLAAMSPICHRRRWHFLFYSTAAAFLVFIASAVGLMMLTAVMNP